MVISQKNLLQKYVQVCCHAHLPAPEPGGLHDADVIQGQDGLVQPQPPTLLSARLEDVRLGTNRACLQKRNICNRL